jgi:hypothetical protein
MNVSNKEKGMQIEEKVYNLLMNARTYSVWDVAKVQVNTEVKTYSAVYKAILKLEAAGKLEEIIAFDKIGGNRVMVRK